MQKVYQNLFAVAYNYKASALSLGPRRQLHFVPPKDIVNPAR